MYEGDRAERPQKFCFHVIGNINQTLIWVYFCGALDTPSQTK